MKKFIVIVTCLFALIFFAGCTPEENPSEQTTFTEVINWLNEQYKDNEIKENIILSDKYQDAKLRWTSKNVEVISNEGKIYPLTEDEEVILECEITIGETSKIHQLSFVVMGRENETEDPVEEVMAIISEWLNNYVVGIDVSNLVLPKTHPNFDCLITWESSHPETLSVDGKVIRPYEADAVVSLSCEISYLSETINSSYDVVVSKIKPGEEVKEISNWLIANYANKLVDGDVVLPTTHPTIPAVLSWLSFYEEILDDNGKYTAPILDQEIEFLCTISFGGKKEDAFIEMTAKGSGTVMDAIKEWVKKQIGSPIIYGFRFPTNYPKYNATFTWSSGNEQIISNNGEVNRPLIGDATVNLTCTITYDGQVEDYGFNVVVLELAARDKCTETKKWLDESFLLFNKIDDDVVLPVVYSPMQATIKWSSSFSNIIDSTGKFTQPISGTNVSLVATVTVGTYNLDVVYNYSVSGFTYTNKWEAIETFLASINYTEIKTQYYKTFGNRTLDVINYGYLPFYDNNNSKIDQRILPYTFGKQRTGTIKKSTQYITVHDTGNNNNGANAEMHWRYINNLNNDPSSTSISWHFTVDEGAVIQNLPLNEVAWHAGDGSREWGTTYFNTGYQANSITGGNMNSIGIETCVDEGSEYNNTMRLTAKLVAELLLEFDLGFDRIKQHNDFSGKDCPMAMRHANRWNEFLFLVELEHFAKVNLSGVTFTWKSLSPTILNDRGEVIVKTGVENKINYQVTVAYDGTVKVYNFESTVMALK
ncbi:MAG TPA: immunoglobulin-like domain-containing protein [Bacilli bacterium]|nr:immunoglobulin-like domain-containing protein [Bacilli bacterium]